jgi:hypothetical protein
MSPTFTNGCGTEPVLGMAHGALSCACSAKMRLYISAAIALVACGGRATAFIVAPAASTVLASQRASSTSRLQAVMTMDSTSNTRRQLFGKASKAAAAILCTEILQTLPAFANDPAWGPQVRQTVGTDTLCIGMVSSCHMQQVCRYSCHACVSAHKQFNIGLPGLFHICCTL